MKSYISVNVVSQALILLAALKHNNCFTRSDIRHIKLPYGVNYKTALAFLEQCGWLSSHEENIEISARGLLINAQFSGFDISPVLWRNILEDYITICTPAWAKRIPYGRKEAYLIMNTEEQRCFDEAGLMESTSHDVVAWWDVLAEMERSKKNVELEQTGRLGEQLTVQYELMRTGIAPYWISVESNLAGYDVLSQRSSECSEKLLIEVKASADNIGYASCIISRHEWDMSQRANNTDRYYFYLWCVHENAHMLARISAEEMKMHIPVDSSVGQWTDARIPFSAFADLFHEISLTT